ncbi:hypothetical protein [Streptomyces mirabilis]|uniref:hypothetical protein n=1 Tax=Streptomyces mirabilis TaxID=68239 RepID=UPI0033B2F0DA
MADYLRRWFAKRGPAAGCLVDLPLKPVGFGVELIESSAVLAHEVARSLESEEELVAGATRG